MRSPHVFSLVTLTALGLAACAGSTAPPAPAEARPAAPAPLLAAPSAAASVSSPLMVTPAPVAGAPAAPKLCRELPGLTGLSVIARRPVALSPAGLTQLDVPGDTPAPRGKKWPDSLATGKRLVQSHLLRGSDWTRLALVSTPADPKDPGAPELWVLARESWTQVPLPPGTSNVWRLVAFGDNVAVVVNAAAGASKLVMARGSLRFPTGNAGCPPNGRIGDAAVASDGSVAFLHDRCTNDARDEKLLQYTSTGKLLPEVVSTLSAPVSSSTTPLIHVNEHALLLGMRVGAVVRLTLIDKGNTSELPLEAEPRATLGTRANGGALLTSSQGIVYLDEAGRTTGQTPWSELLDAALFDTGNIGAFTEGIDNAVYFEASKKGAKTALVLRCARAT